MFRRLDLDRLVSVAVIVAAGVVIWSYVRTWNVGGTGSTDYVVGDRIAGVGMEGGTATRALLFYVNSGCKFCTQSMPFYSEVVRRRNSLKSDVAVVAMSLDDEQALQGYITTHGLTPDRLLSVANRSDVKLSRTPTVLLVDKRGKILRVWVGLLKPDAQQQVFNALTS